MISEFKDKATEIKEFIELEDSKILQEATKVVKIF